MIKLIIFDFDGTIVDSKAVYFNAMNRHLNILGIGRKIIEKEISLGLNLAETMKRIIPSFFYRWWIKRKIVNDVLKEANDVHKCRDVNAIAGLKAKKILISNSFSDFVMPIAKHLRLKKLFDEIHCADEFDDKAEFIADYLKKHKIKGSECIYIGDRTSDAYLAKKAGCVSVLVSGKCSWEPRSKLIEAEPDFIVDDLKQIAEIVDRKR